MPTQIHLSLAVSVAVAVSHTLSVSRSLSVIRARLHPRAGRPKKFLQRGELQGGTGGDVQVVAYVVHHSYPREETG
jgi:hypothetical protein